FGPGELAEKAIEESRAKYPTPEELREQLTRLERGWAALRARLEPYLIPFVEAKDMLREAGCPTEPEQIGITRERLRLSYELATYIRRRFTILDLAQRLGVMDSALDHLFGPEGPWSTKGSRP